MDLTRNKLLHTKYKLLRNSKGQSTVEYILLLAVVVGIAATIFKATDFNNIFGPNGSVAQEYKDRLEFAYRHGLIVRGGRLVPDYSSGRHESYNNRFFSASEGYPR